MSVQGSVTAEELVRALERRGGTLPAEIATFVVLEACEVMLSAAGPRDLTGLAELRISEHGTTSVGGAGSDDEAAARSLHRCLALLLKPVEARLAPALARLVDRGPPGGTFSLRALRDELEAALVPLNRNASRRVLSRFARDAGPEPADALEVQSALTSLLQGVEEPANDVDGRPSHARLSGEEGPNAALGDDEASFLGGPVARPLREPSAREATPKAIARERLTSGPPLRPLGPTLAEESEAARSRRVFLGFSVLALAVTAATLMLTLRRNGEATPRDSEPPALKDEARPAERADLIVHVPERDVQILRFVGHSPVDVARVPIGRAHEYVATLEGYLPARALIPAQADWEATEDGARYEVALQLDAAGDAGARTRDLGASQLPDNQGKPLTDVGTVRVISTPRGARIYEMIGFSPTAELRDFAPAEVEEILIYREGSPPLVRTVRADDYRATSDRKVAEITLSLTVPP